MYWPLDLRISVQAPMYSRLGSRRRSEKAIPSIMTLLKFFAAQVLIMSSPEYISISSMPSKRVPRALLDALYKPPS